MPTAWGFSPARPLIQQRTYHDPSLTRRAALVLGAAYALPAFAQDLTPADRQSRVYVGTTAGSSPDRHGRIITEPLAERLDPAIGLIENRPAR